VAVLKGPAGQDTEGKRFHRFLTPRLRDGLTAMEIGIGMTIVIVRKIAEIGKMNSERLKIVAGSHTMKQKARMLMQAKFWLHEEHGIDKRQSLRCLRVPRSIRPGIP
jgi:hypothetical protein